MVTYIHRPTVAKSITRSLQALHRHFSRNALYNLMHLWFQTRGNIVYISYNIKSLYSHINTWPSPKHPFRNMFYFQLWFYHGSDKYLRLVTGKLGQRAGWSGNMGHSWRNAAVGDTCRHYGFGMNTWICTKPCKPSPSFAWVVWWSFFMTSADI